MLDIKFIRENKDLVAEAARKKKLDFKVDELLAVDDKRRAILTAVEEMRAKQNSASTAMVSATGEEQKKLVAFRNEDSQGIHAGERSRT